MRTIFAKDLSRVGRIHDWNQRKTREQEPGRVQFVRVKSLHWWFVITFRAIERSNGSIRNMLKNTYRATFLACRATTCLLYTSDAADE